MGCRDSALDPVYRDGRWFDSKADWFAWVTAGKPAEWPTPDPEHIGGGGAKSSSEGRR